MSEREHRIVVGIDGSDHSKDALRWAVRQAKLTGGAVDAVSAWRFPASYGWADIAIPDFDLEAEATRALSEVVTEVCGADPGVRVRAVVIEGAPTEVLINAAADAALLIVGSRGRGGFRSAVLGSVSLGCVLNAHCPVLVLRYGQEAAEPG